MATFAVILPAAGRSTRFGGTAKKPFTPLAGQPIWLRSVDLFFGRHDVVQCIVVIAPEDREDFGRRFGLELAARNLHVAAGGAERFESIANALSLVRPDVDFVAVHDAARPCTPPDRIDAVFQEASRIGAALLAIPVADTVKQVDENGRVHATVPRRGLWLAQTPQVFRRDWLLDAYSRRQEFGRDITDDAQLVEAAGHAVHVVPGVAANLKITTQHDLALAEAFLRARTDLLLR